MPNVLLTQRCVRSCPYCFARKYLSESQLQQTISWEDLIYAADLQQMSGERSLSLLGGEPTLHPEFLDFVLYLVARGFHVTVFTSGIMSERLRKEMEAAFHNIPQGSVSFVCNLNDPAISPEPEQTQVNAFLHVFGPRVSPGFNIYRTDFRLEFIFDSINRYGLERNLRLGLAHPIAGHDNLFISPQEIPAVVARLVSYFPLFERHKVRPGLDCGFPLCKFSADELGQLYCLARREVHFGCSPAIDIGPGMDVWGCFPLTAFRRRSLYEFDSMAQVYEAFSQTFNAVRVEVGGIFEECDACEHRASGMCAGGCLAHALNLMQDEAPVRHLLYEPR